jgi:hypothetical protein
MQPSRRVAVVQILRKSKGKMEIQGKEPEMPGLPKILSEMVAGGAMTTAAARCIAVYLLDQSKEGWLRIADAQLIRRFRGSTVKMKLTTAIGMATAGMPGREWTPHWTGGVFEIPTAWHVAMGLRYAARWVPGTVKPPTETTQSAV